MAEKMKAAVFKGPGRMDIEEVDVPAITDEEVLVKVEACAICGTDARIYAIGQKNVKPPHILGHEIAGTVAEAGSRAGSVPVGRKVTLVTSVGCGSCRFCRKGLTNMCVDSRHIGYYFPGGFAQYLKVPADAVRMNNILEVPTHLNFPDISLIEPLSCCVNGQGFLDIQAGETVAVVGAGPIGCMHAELARAKGAAKVLLFDISDARLELAARFGNLVRINNRREDMVKRTLELTEGRGADVVIVACGSNKAQEESVKMTAVRGRISLFAGLPKDKPTIELDANLVHYREMGVFGAFASNRAQFEEALEHLAGGRIKAAKFITHKVPLDGIVEGIAIAKSGKGLKVVVEVNR